MSQTILIILLIIVIALLLWIVFSKKESSENKGKDVGLELIQKLILESNRMLDSKLSESTKTMNESVRNQFSESAKLIKDVTQVLTKLD